MKKQIIIKEEIQKTLKTIEKIERVKGNPYFFTRLKAKLEKENPVLKKKRWFWNPSIHWAMLMLLLVLNVCVVQTQFEPEANDDLIDKVAEEYGIDQNGIGSMDFFSEN